MSSLPDPGKPHHRARGFQNNYIEFQPKSLAELLRWRREAARAGLPRPPLASIPQVAPDLPWLHANAQAGAQMAPALTWIGHSTVMAQLGGLTLLTDPMFSERASPVQFAGPRRHVPPGIALRALPHVDLVLVSHNHYDHLDSASVNALNRQPGGPPLFVVPLGLEPWFRAQGIRHAVELDWWDSHRIATPQGEADVVLVPAQHWSSRGPRDALATLWGGFAVLAPDCHLLFAGDTGYSRDFSDIRRHFESRQTKERGGGFDIALLPIGAYAPRWFMSAQHVNVEEALPIHDDLGAKRSLGVHWGTFELTDESLDEPPRKLAELRAARGMPEDEFFVMAIGETRKLAPRALAMRETRG
ncbi:MBL fold metallo-hydrolase [Variovorax sp. MHTC-1]|uniref:MBL fold metallo-hydrolase n=1 Tax=Variovorax sp. MHTC-1 TaxID=2495593 RepID=UPI000F86C957|nr:MBL fold metallo-hydrolase [Variovorax sp. MHTC-1]RST49766.1 MBL fold metallo-hydrolase [Variovorax sp. MHTC-1]